MITKGIIKKVPLDEENTYQVYIPYFRKANDSEKDSTYIATRCIIPGIYDDLNVNDIVYVGFEDNIYDRPIILGKLFLNNRTEEESTTKLNISCLHVSQKTSLSNDTQINKTNMSQLITKINNVLDTTETNNK